MTGNLSKADAVADPSELGRMLAPGSVFPSFRPFDHGVNYREKEESTNMNQPIQLKTTASSLRNLVSRSPCCGKDERQSRKR